MQSGDPITIALVNDYDVVVQGLNQLFEGDERFRVLELEAGGLPDRPVEIALYDTFADEDDTEKLRTLVELPEVGRVVVYSWTSEPERVEEALAVGAAGFVSKQLTADQLKDALIRVHAGERVVEGGPEPEPEPDDAADPGVPSAKAGGNGARPADWPGRAFGLTYREAEVVALISDALTNVEIAERLFLSINSVKSHIRSAYRKMAVERRSQAVRWAHENGFAKSGQSSDNDTDGDPE